jgi:hypothetical protein
VGGFGYGWFPVPSAPNGSERAIRRVVLAIYSIF